MTLSVAVFTSEPEIFGIRLAPLLAALVKSGTVADHVVLDRDLRRVGEHGADRFNAVIVQRNISGTQLDFLARNRLRFIYDIDDLIPKLPAHRHRDTQETTRRIAWCLANADAVATPNRKLASELMAATGTDFGPRSIIVPNGLEPVPVDESKWMRPATKMLWVSSDLPLVETEAPGLAEAIAAAVNGLGLKATLIGRFPQQVRSLFSQVEHVPRLAFADYRRFLASASETVAIAPLPIRSENHQAFVDSKSDIKAVDFLGHGIAAVYSASWPYRHSDLSPAPLVANSAQAWRDAIAEVAANPAGSIERSHVEAVARLRSYDTVAAILGRHLTEASMPHRPLPRPSLNAILRGWERKLRSWRGSKS